MANTDTNRNGRIELNEYTHSISEAMMELAAELEIDWKYTLYFWFKNCKTINIYIYLNLYQFLLYLIKIKVFFIQYYICK